MTMKKVFITGAGGFIGSEMACILARQGMAIAASDIQEEALKDTVAKIEAEGGVAKAYPMDVSDPAQVDAAFKAACEDLGGLDVLIYCAGGAARAASKILIEQSDDVIMRVLNNNLYGAIWSSRAAARLMIRQGTGGNIVFLASLIGLMGGVANTDYAASKAGLMAFTPALAKELAPYKIRVNCIAPGVVIRPPEGNRYHRAYETNVLGEKCVPGDVTDLAAYIISDEARFLTGQTYVLDGGRGLSLKGTD